MRRASAADWWGNGDLATSYRIDARRGRRYRMRQIAAMVPSSMHSIADHHAVRLLRSGIDLGFDELRRRNAALWAGAVAGTAGVARRRRGVAGPRRRGLLLPAVVRPPLEPGQHEHLRSRPVAGLPLLLRARDVGHRGVRRAAAAPDPARGGGSDAGLPTAHAGDRQAQRPAARSPRRTVPVAGGTDAR